MSDNLIIVLDDRPYSIREQLAAMEHYGFERKVYTDPITLSLDTKHGIDPKMVRAVILDLHIPGADAGFEILGISKPSTQNDYLAGYTVAQHIVAERFPDVPIAFVSAMLPESGWTSRNLPDSEKYKFFQKGGDNKKFEEFLRSLVRDVAQPTPVAFGAIVRPAGRTPDGSLIELIDPLYDEIVRSIVKNPRFANELSPRKWEELVAGTYKRAGFDEVILTPRSGDLGRDVIAIKNGVGSVKFIEQVKAYAPHRLITADEVRSLLGVLAAEHDASKAIFSTTSGFAPLVASDPKLLPYFPHRLELVDRPKLLARLSWSLNDKDEKK